MRLKGKASPHRKAQDRMHYLLNFIKLLRKIS
ncbi:rCG32010 [Rattus norvegicus]|uniref:RCG32010 n=1 Tax=Rattus norvegicus TaxID=10116 RepID=A6KDU6_RAT|nr:rCG32010 [Rattus norvegicus]